MFTARGQSIIDDGLAPKAKVRGLAADRFVALDLLATALGEFDTCCAFDTCFAFARWCAHVPPLATNTVAFAGCLRFVEAAALLFSQPSRHPVPAIQSATAKASVILMILNEVNLLIPIQV